MYADQLPLTGFVRLSQIIGAPKANPPIPAIIPVGRSTWWEGVRTGRFPKPCKPFGPRITCWRVEDVRALIEDASETGRKS
jgi:predicted DNA-binding transcriptional regulator AlpA